MWILCVCVHGGGGGGKSLDRIIITFNKPQSAIVIITVHA